LNVLMGVWSHDYDAIGATVYPYCGCTHAVSVHAQIDRARGGGRGAILGRNTFVALACIVCNVC